MGDDLEDLGTGTRIFTGSRLHAICTTYELQLATQRVSLWKLGYIKDQILAHNLCFDYGMSFSQDK